jgi:hypothetical protein
MPKQAGREDAPAEYRRRPQARSPCLRPRHPHGLLDGDELAAPRVAVGEGQHAGPAPVTPPDQLLGAVEDFDLKAELVLRLPPGRERVPGRYSELRILSPHAHSAGTSRPSCSAKSSAACSPVVVPPGSIPAARSGPGRGRPPINQGTGITIPGNPSPLLKRLHSMFAGVPGGRR